MTSAVTTSQKPAMHVIVVFLCYFVILAAYASYMSHPVRQIDAFATTARDLLTLLPSDPGSFMTGALNIADKGWISPENNWIINLWPPGFLLLEAGLIKLIGADTPYFVYVIQLLACAAWAGVLVKFNRVLRSFVSVPLAWILPLLLFTPSVARSFLLEPSRVIFGETFSIALFFLGVLCALQACGAAQPRKLAIATGVSFGLAAYFRSQFELFVLGLTFWLLVAWLWSLLRAKHRSGKGRWMGIALTAIISAHVVMAPWRIYHQVTMGSPKWVYTDAISFSTSVTSRDQLLSQGGAFIVEGGGGLACRIDPTTCGRLDEAPRLFVRTLLTHPLEWHAIKFGLIGNYFFASQQDMQRPGAPVTVWDTVTNAFFLIAIIVALLTGVALARRRSIYAPVLNWTNVTVVSAYYLIFIVHQYEVRYFYFGKLYATLITLIGLTLLFTRQKHRPAEPILP
nr:hypothetical protein [uncultured Achromobacter sp.]